VLVGLGAVLLLAAAGAAFLGSRWALFRLQSMREAELKRKSAAGPPKEDAALTVVITDIDGYSSARACPGAGGRVAFAAASPPRRAPCAPYGLCSTPLPLQA
jgi:hypothetical protein